MSTPRLSEQVKQETLDLVRKYGSVSVAARAVGMPQGTLQTRWRIATGDVGATTRVPAPPPVEQPPIYAAESVATPRLDFERAWQMWMREIGMARDRYAGPAVPRARKGRLKILVIPDLHAPFHDAEAVASMLERERDIDIAVIMGDVGDGYSLSRFLKYETVPYEEELASVTLLLQAFSERFPLVRIIVGNHDGPRLEKQLLERLPADMISAIRSMTGGTLDPIEALCRRFGNIERVMPSTSNNHKLRWMTQIGDAVFMHAEKFSKVPGSALRAIDEWVTDFDEVIGLKDYRVLVQAHTHQLGWFPWKANRLLIECGCLASSLGYQYTARLGGRPQRRGYVVLEQVDGRTDINATRVVWLDGELRKPSGAESVCEKSMQRVLPQAEAPPKKRARRVPSRKAARR